MYPQVFGKYVLERELARGGMARVLLATLRGAGGFEKRLVVKQVRDELACDEEFVGRFVEEAKTTVALAHPNIVPVYELGVELGTYFLAMEYVEGASLAELLRVAAQEQRPLSPEEGAYVGVEVCRALDYAHRRMNVVHRDVTPRNVMVDEEGQVKVIDFGISAPVATAPSGHGVFGSPGHMPPEQMEGKQLTPAADVFAVAVLLMELWSAKPVFRRHTNDEILAAMHAPHLRPSDADVRLLPLDEIVARAMSLDPAARPQQADDLARALRKFLSGLDLGDVAHKLGARVRSVRAHPPPPPPETKAVLQRPPSRPTATQVGTKTFAARDGEWQGPSTRRIAPSRPPHSTAGVDTDVAQSPATPAHETIGAGRPRIVGLAAAFAGAVALAAFLVGRGAANRDVAPMATVGPAATIHVVPTSSPSAVSQATGATPSASPQPPTASHPPGPTAPLVVPPVVSERATLFLLGDGTLVSIDGVPRGAPPARVTVEAGSHTVLFSFPATGESKSEVIAVRAAEHATLRADFTGIAPTIRVQR
jgi:serine/threonine protein kinase